MIKDGYEKISEFAGLGEFIYILQATKLIRSNIFNLDAAAPTASRASAQLPGRFPFLQREMACMLFPDADRSTVKADRMSAARVFWSTTKVTSSMPMWSAVIVAIAHPVASEFKRKRTATVQTVVHKAINDLLRA